MLSYLQRHAPVITSLVRHVFEHWRTLTCSALDQNKGRATAYTCGKLCAERSLRLAGMVGAIFAEWTRVCAHRRVRNKAVYTCFTRANHMRTFAALRAWRRFCVTREAGALGRARKITQYLSAFMLTWKEECSHAHAGRTTMVTLWARALNPYARARTWFARWCGVVRSSSAMRTALTIWYGSGCSVPLRDGAAHWCMSVLRVVKMRCRHVLR
jgi:hypothetical protein